MKSLGLRIYTSGGSGTRRNWLPRSEKPAYESVFQVVDLPSGVPDGRPLPALDRAAKLGAKTVVFHEDWGPLQIYPATSEERELKRLIEPATSAG